MDINSLLELDRYLLHLFNGSESLFLDGVIQTLTSGLTWIPLYISLIYLIIKNNDTMWQILLTIGCVILCVILADGMADFIMKPLVGRLRPCYDPIIKNTIDTIGIPYESDYGFFSAHAANTFSIAIFTSLLIRDRTFVTSIIIWSFVNCYTRLYLGVHYPSDIIFGLLWGAIVGLFVYFIFYRIYCKFNPPNSYISTQYSRTGYNLNDINIVMCVMMLTFCYAIIKGLIII